MSARMLPVPAGLLPAPDDPAQDIAILSERLASCPRFLPIIGDYMEPTFKRGGFAAIAPACAYDGAGVYACDFGFGPALFTAEKVIGADEIAFCHSNPRYAVYRWPRAQFDAGVIGKAFAAIDVLDRRLLECQPSDKRAAR